MSVWGIEAGIAVMLVVASLPLAIGPIVYLHYKHHGKFAGWPALLTTVTFLYGWGLAAFTLFPLPSGGEVFCRARQDLTFWQLVPFASLGDIARVVADSGIVATLTSSTFLMVFFNVVLLVPLGMLLAYRYRRNFRFTVLAGFGVSLLIELTQGTGIWGMFDCPYRLADVDDLIANTAGAALGWAIGVALARVLPDPNPPPSDDLDPPTVRRRIGAGLLDLVFFVVIGLSSQFALNIVLNMTMGSDFIDLPWLTTAQTLLGTGATGAALFLVVPMIRRDRATLGQVSTWLAPSPVDETAYASRRAAAIRFALRWLPMLAAAFLQPLLALGIVAAYELVTVIVRRDRRSLSGVASGTTTVTKRQVEAAPRDPRTDPAPTGSG